MTSPSAPSVVPYQSPGTAQAAEAAVVRKVLWRILPFAILLYLMNYIDRVNISIAKLSMQADPKLNPGIDAGHLVFTDAVYAAGASIFFIAYFLFEIPSNLIQEKVGPRRWMARIMISWGLVSMSFMFVRGPTSFNILRFLLGAAEAGFFPGMILYLSQWIPKGQRARAGAFLLTSTAIAGVIGNPLGGWILYSARGWGGLSDWQWLFLIESIPTIILGVIILFYLTDAPKDAKWLTSAEKDLLIARLAQERQDHPASHTSELRHALLSPDVWSLGFLYSMLMFGFYTINYWTPSLIKTALTTAGAINASTPRHVEYAMLGLLSAIPFGAAAIGMVIIGLHSDRKNERRWHVAWSAIVGAAGLALAAFSATLFTGMGGAIASIVGLSIAAIGIWSTLGPFWTFPPHLLTGTAAAAGIALVNSLGNLGGGFVGPNVLAWLKKTTGSDFWGLLLGSATLIIGAVLVICLRTSHRNASRGFPLDDAERIS